MKEKYETGYTKCRHCQKDLPGRKKRGLPFAIQFVGAIIGWYGKKGHTVTA